MIRILHYVSIMNRGGQETFLMNVFRNIDRNDVMFDFLCTINEDGDYDKEIGKLGGIVYNLPTVKCKIQLFDRCISLAKFLKEHSKEYKVFHIHTQSAMIGYLASKIAINHGIKKVVVHSHSSNTLYHPKLHKLFRLFLKNKRITKFACSELAGNWLFGKGANFKVIKNGIDTRVFSYSEKIRNEVRDNNGWTNKHVIGHVGSFTYPKNHDYLIDIFAEVIKLDDRAILVLVGTGPLLDKIKRKVISLGLQDRVYFMGSRADIAKLDNTFDVFVFPSHYEGLPIAFVEAQSTGVPCVVSDTLPKEAFISNSVESLSIRNDPKKWALKIECLLKEKTDRTNSYRKVIKAGFDIDSTAKVLHDFYCEQ